MVEGSIHLLCLAGSGRSGSTLLALLLGQQHGILSVGEFHRFWVLGKDQLCGCGVPVASCAFWRKATDHAAVAVPGFDRPKVARLERRLFHNRGTNLFSLRSRLRRDRELFAAAMDARAAVLDCAMDQSGAHLVVDSSQRAAYLMALRESGRFEMRLVHIVRDPRAMTHSFGRVKPNPTPANPKAVMPRRGMVRAVATWLAVQLAVELRLRRKFPVVRVRYEDLCRDPEGTVRSVLAFAGEPTAELGETATILPGVQHLAAGNPVARGDSERTPVRLDDAWRREMPRWRQWFVSAATLPFMVRYGYLGRGART